MVERLPVTPNSLEDGTDSAQMLLRRIAAGDREAFGALYRRYGPRVAAMVRRKVGAPHLVEELVQDIFIAAWQTAQGYRSDLGEPESWLLGITRHKLQDHWRRLARIAATVGIPSEGPPRGAMPDPAVGLSVAEALRSLSADQCRVIILLYGNGLTCAEAARVLGVPVGTVKSRANAALGRMKAFLSESTPP